MTRHAAEGLTPVSEVLGHEERIARLEMDRRRVRQHLRGYRYLRMPSLSMPDVAVGAGLGFGVLAAGMLEREKAADGSTRQRPNESERDSRSSLSDEQLDETRMRVVRRALAAAGILRSVQAGSGIAP